MENALLGKGILQSTITYTLVKKHINVTFVENALLEITDLKGTVAHTQGQSNIPLMFNLLDK